LEGDGGGGATASEVAHFLCAKSPPEDKHFIHPAVESADGRAVVPGRGIPVTDLGAAKAEGEGESGAAPA